MKKLWRIFRRFTLVLIILLLVTVVGVALFVHLERSRVLLRDQLVTAMNAALRGEVRIGRIEGVFWRTFTLSDVTITHHNVETLRVPRLTARYDLFALWNGLIRVTGVEVENPTIRLIQDAQGNWNLLEALSAKVPAAPAEAQAEGFAILLDTIAIQGATIEVTLAGQGVLPYRLAETNLLMQVAMKSGRTEVQVKQLMTQLHADPLPPVLVDATLTYQDMTTPATVHLANLTLETPQSHLRVTGDVSNLETLDTTADLVIDKLATAEIKQLVPTWPLTEDISGTLHINEPLSDLHTQLTVAATDARITGDIRADLKREPFSYEGTLTLSGFDTQKMLQRPDVSGVLDGTVKVRGLGTAVAALEGKADLTVRALAVSHWQLGTVTVSGSMAQQRGTITGTLASTLGQATWQGAIDLTSPRPRYQVNLALEHLDIKKAPSGMKPITSDLNLTVALSGQGVTLSDIEARTDVSLRPSTIGPVTLDRGRLSAQMEKDRVHIAEFTLNAKETTVAVSGDIGTSSTQPGQLTYALHVGNVAPWLSLAEQQGTGALHLTGKAQGSISNLQLQGELQTQNLRVATNTIQDGSVIYQLENIGQPHPSGAITATLQNIDAGVTLKHAEVKVLLPKNLQPTAPVLAQVDLSLRDAALRTHQLQGEVSYQAARVTARIAALAIETPDGRLTLAQPTQIVQEKDRITIEPLLMRNGAQEIHLAGQGGLSGPQDLHLRIDQVPLALLQTLGSPRPEIGGLLTVDARITGTAAAPQLTSTLDVTGLRVAGQDYAGLVAALGYDSQRAALDVTFQQDSTHSLTATGTLPVIVKWADGWHAGVQGDMALQVRSSGLDLAFLNAFTDRTVNKVGGNLGLDLAVTGPVSNPQPRGSFALTQGQATLTPLGVRIEQVLVQGQVDPQAIRIVELSARSGDGRLTGSGEIALRDYLPQQLNLSLTADRWPVIHTPRYQVELDGQMNGQGPLSHPQVTGKLRILKATIRPDLEFLTAQPVQRDPTIMVLAADRGAPTPAPATAAGSDTPTPLPKSEVGENLTLDVTIRLPRNTWIKHQDADIELAGRIHVTKQAGGKPILVGTINVVRGWLNLQRRRFTLTRGQVAFTGGEVVNPTLDIIAQYRLPQYVVEAVVGGTLEKPALTLRSEPALEQADILALLLFGKPVNALGSEEKTSLQQQALQVTGGYVAAQIGESVSQALGLEDLGIDLRQVDLTGGRVGFGRYLGPKTYISASQDFSGQAGSQVSVDYYLSSQWKLNTSSSTGGNTGADNAASITWEKRY